MKRIRHRTLFLTSIRLLVVAAAICAAIRPLTAGAQIVQNGSFETGNLSPGWSATGQASVQTYTSAQDGTYFCAFNDGNLPPNGVLRQTVNTTSGASYTLTFYTGIIAYVPGDQIMKVMVTGSSELANQTYTHTSPGTINPGSYTERTITFTADSSTTTLEFRDQSPPPSNSIDLLLDNVVVTAVTPVGYPTITTHPTDQYSTVAHPVTLTVAATGSAPLTYQWNKNGTPIVGAISSDYTIPLVLPTDAADYACTATNANGSATSDAAKLTVPITPTLLRRNTANGRYFKDAIGKAVYLTGAHTFMVFQDLSTKPNFNYSDWFRFMASKGHNFLRAWQMDQTRMEIIDGGMGTISPFPFKRTGPGNSADGVGLKFDLNQYDDDYFARLRNRCIEAERHGLYVSIMLFDGIWRDRTGDTTAWAWHPYNPNNNINGQGIQRHQVYTMANSDWVNSMKAYARKLIDTVNDLDNVLFEIGNEMPFDTETFQNAIVNEIHTYEAIKAKQHMVGMTAYDYVTGSAAEDTAYNNSLTASSTDWISPSSRSSSYAMPRADGGKVSLWDSDHTWGFPYSLPSTAGADWVWRALTRGQNPIYLSTPAEINSRYRSDPAIENAMGWARTVALRCDLDNMVPNNASSTEHCLGSANEYLVYQPSNAAFTITDMPVKIFNYEWINPVTGSITETGSITTSAGNNEFNPPAGHSAGALLHLLRPVVPLRALSRKIHPGAGILDIDLPLSGPTGIESRSVTGNHSMVIEFARPVTLAGASVTTGVGGVSSASVSGSQVTVELGGVANAQTINVTLSNVNDGTTSNDVAVSMSVLTGDTNRDRFVNSADISQPKTLLSQLLNGSNWILDINTDGWINYTDIALAKEFSGTALP